MYILRVCKRYGYNGEMFHFLFHPFIMSLFTSSVSQRRCPSYSTYLCGIDKLQDRAVKFE